MLLQLNLKKSALSSWFLLFFAIIVVVGAGVSQFFQAPLDIDKGINRYQSLFQPGQILGLREVVLKNSLGTFHFEREDNNKDSPWSMVSPRSFPANSKIINDIVSGLQFIKIRTVHQLDAINISNYSLDAPSLELTLIDNDKKMTHLKFGLVNPIDNSTFVTLSDQKAIYHIDDIKKSFGNLDLTDFINTNLISLNHNEIQKIKIRRQHKESDKVTLKVEYKQNKWQGQSGNTLQSDKIMRYFEALTSLKSGIILDEVSTKQQEQIKQYFEKPLYSITISDRQGKDFKYEVSTLVRGLDGLKLEKWQNVLFRSKSSKFVYVLQKDVLKFFNRSEKNMRTLSIKKLFY